MSIRRILPLAATLLLGGCVTDYSYHHGYGGDYYSGAPRVEYRYITPGGVYYSYSPYAYPGYGYGYGGYGGYGYYGGPGYYGHHHGYGYPYWYNPYYYGGGWGYWGPYSPQRPPPVPVTPPPPRPPGPVIPLETRDDGVRWPGLDQSGRRYGNPVPRTIGTGGRLPPSSIQVLPPPPPPSAPRIIPPPAPTLPPTYAPVTQPTGVAPVHRERTRSRIRDPNEP
jgi:hypothetical protein